MPGLTLSLFGSPRIAKDGVPIDLPSRKALALLAYLTVTGIRHRRTVLAALFWPESDRERAQNAMRYTLSLLRRSLGGRWLAADRDTVGLDGSQEDAVDVLRFRTLLAQCRAHKHGANETCPECLPLLGEAVELHKSDFLAGFTLRDSIEFDTWQSLETESLRQELVGVLERLVGGFAAQGDVEQASVYTKRWLALDPLDEAAHRALMRVYAGSGQQTAALRQYEACERVLMDELGVMPSEETTDLYTAIRERRVGQPYHRPPLVVARQQVRCPHCGAENSEGARYCMKCGARLALVCPECGTELPPDPEARFCLSCGTEVVAPPAADASDSIPQRLERVMPREFSQRLLATRGEVARERRVVTILFSDVKGSTPMTQELDPEDLMEVMEGALDVLIEPVTHYEGTLARLMGDAVLAFFGAPIAHEDDAERACRAALDIIAEAQHYAARLAQQRGISGFNVRVGIHTGLVVVGEVGADLRVGYTAVGDAVSVASGIQAAAEPGTVLITEDTHRLVAPLFETETLGPIHIVDRAELVLAYRVLASADVVGKGRGIAGLSSPLVGREAEISRLREALQHLQAGVGGIVTIVGEAGIGKSRLVAELRREADPLDVRWVEGRCLSYGESMAYMPWVDMLHGLLDMSVRDTPGESREALRRFVEVLCPDHSDEVYPFLGRMMSLPLEDEVEERLAGLQPEGLQVLTFRAVERVLETVASDGSVVLVCEDLHWADTSSLELLEQVLGLTDRASLLLICAFRPYTEHGCWTLRETIARLHRHHHTDLWLESLSAADSEELVDNLLEVEALPRLLRRRILDHAEGNPFYVEEVIRALIDSEVLFYDDVTARWQAAREVEDIAIPDTLQGVLMSRIDRLQEEARRVLQMASVIGRRFLHRILVAVAMNERDLDTHLLTLQREEMIRPRARVPELVYIFKHHLTQQAAYNRLLRRERRQLHRQVAEVLERLFPDRIEEQLGVVAYHWEGAGDRQRAGDYLRRAGEQAAVQFANAEAVGYFTRALGLTPEENLTARYDLLLARETVCDLQGAREAQTQDLVALEALAAALGDDRRRAEVALRRAHYGMQTTDFPEAMAAAQDAINLARSAGDTYLEASAHLQAGRVLAELRELQASQQSLERALSLAREAGTSAAVRTDPQAEGPAGMLPRLEAQCLLQIGVLCDYQDDRDRGASFLRQALRRSRELGDQDTEAEALLELGKVLSSQGKYDSATVHFRQSIEILRQLGHRQPLAWALRSLGRVRAQLGDFDGARLYLEQSLPILRETQHAWGVGSALCTLTFLSLRLGDAEQARQRAQEALQVAVEASDLFNQAFATEALGYALADLGRLDEAYQTLEKGLDLARQAGFQGSVMFCLGGLAETSLAQGNLTAALGHAESILTHMETSAWDTQADPTRMCLACYRALRANGDPRADDVLERAHALLQERAANISDEADRRSYLENREERREIVREYARTRGRRRTKDE